jgi:hypothetical protein
VGSADRVEQARHRVREATDQFLVGEGPALADQLFEALFVLSGDIARLRRATPQPSPEADGMHTIDDALTACVGLARRLSMAVRAHEEPGSYTDAARIARDLGRHLGPTMPDGTTLNVVCPPSPALATMPSSELRRVLATLVRWLVAGAGSPPGELALEVVEDRPRPPGRSTVKLLIGHTALAVDDAAAAAAAVRAEVNARGGSVEPSARKDGGATVVVSLPSAC